MNQSFRKFSHAFSLDWISLGAIFMFHPWPHRNVLFSMFLHLKSDLFSLLLCFQNSFKIRRNEFQKEKKNVFQMNFYLSLVFFFAFYFIFFSSCPFTYWSSCLFYWMNRKKSFKSLSFNFQRDHPHYCLFPLFCVLKKVKR